MRIPTLLYTLLLVSSTVVSAAPVTNKPAKPAQSELLQPPKGPPKALSSSTKIPLSPIDESPTNSALPSKVPSPAQSPVDKSPPPSSIVAPPVPPLTSGPPPNIAPPTLKVSPQVSPLSSPGNSPTSAQQGLPPSPPSGPSTPNDQTPPSPLRVPSPANSASPSGSSSPARSATPIDSAPQTGPPSPAIQPSIPPTDAGPGMSGANQGGNRRQGQVFTNTNWEDGRWL
ncbi:Hypothetical protein D9617_7g030240 [Elsinoe fawcettii]|nr:Hypothetical protein D9617_7g030240 [Elsinoe fawcettii]